MNDDIAVVVRNVSKRYLLYDRPQDRLKQSLLWRFGRNYAREFWALRDVSFQLRKGEALGIIGLNGSGKSTLLQIVAGTLVPTRGKLEVNGRVTALLELGSGFNPEFTGRENVFLNGAILGLSQAQMEGRYEQIATFADIGEFIDQPVKLYSSGMLLRLAFAVAVFVDPDILVIDEALAVGDIGFQQKCLHHIETLRKRQVTLLLVSHDIQMVKNYCSAALYLDDGNVRMQGNPEPVTEAYLKDIYSRQQQSREHKDHVVWKRTGDGETAFGTGHGEIRVFSLWCGDEETNVFYQGQTLTVKVTAWVDETVFNPNLTLQLRDFRGYPIYGTDTLAAGIAFPVSERGNGIIQAVFSFEVVLALGPYSFVLGLNDQVSDEIVILHEKLVGALNFTVLECSTKGKFHGVVDLKAHCERIPVELETGLVDESRRL